MNESFWTVHEGLPRQGPGDRASVDRALGGARLAPDAHILDAGCGPGADIADLLRHVPGGHVTAIELHGPFVTQAAERYADDARVTCLTGDMAKPEGRYDLIWCAGALYFLGVTEGLRAWRDALRPDGQVVFSEVVWFGAERPADAVAQFQDYPAMSDRDGVEERIAAAGYRTLDRWDLPDAAWEAYYTPMEARIATLRDGAAGDLLAALDAAAEEIRVWRTYRRNFGYTMFRVAPA